jgi:Zn-dependent peptidase ImmA (M78 family)
MGVNDVQSEYRQRFTIGHELGHYLLYHHEHFHIDLGRTSSMVILRVTTGRASGQPVCR